MLAWRFLVYGLLGWCIEIIWTSIYDFCRSFRRAPPPHPRPDRWQLVGSTYLWMLPIYGAGGLLFEEAHNLLRLYPTWMRTGIYSLLCFMIEYISGWTLRRLTGRCPWDYSWCPVHLHGLIRPDYALAWGVLGLAFEKVHDILIHILPCFRAAMQALEKCAA